MGTPDLRNRFIVGAGNDTGGHIPNGVGGIAVGFFKPGNFGGEEMHKLTITEIPIHNHGAANYYFVGPQNSGGGGPGHVGEPYPIRASTSVTAGGDQAHNNMPPYYALAYIMKL